MAGFGFSEDQEFFRAHARKVAQREFPGARPKEAPVEPPRAVMKKLGELGLLGISLPQQYGGLGSDWVSFGIGVEELGKADLLVGLSLIVPALAYLSIEAEGLRQEWAPQFVRGSKLVSLAVTEPGAGSDIEAMTTAAVRHGDHYILTGRKTPVTFGCESDIGVVFARFGQGATTGNMACFLVPLDSPGVARKSVRQMGWDSLATAEIEFDGVRLPEHNCASAGDARAALADAAAVLRAALGILAAGMAQASLEDAISFAEQRTAFGRPITEFQGVSFKIAEHLTRVESARLMCYRAFYLRDKGLPHARESAMCKWLSSAVAFDAIHDALLIHGHVGYSQDYPLARRLRDIVGFDFAGGTEQILQEIIARQVMGQDGMGL